MTINWENMAVIIPLLLACFTFAGWVIKWIFSVNSLRKETADLRKQVEDLENDIRSFTKLVTETGQKMDSQVNGLLQTLLSTRNNQ